MNTKQLVIARRRAGWLGCKGRADGFTLVEAMVVLAVAALLVSMGVPSMAAALDSIRLTSASNVFLADLHYARSEAIKRSGRVVMCKSASGQSCDPDGGWHQGWIVFHDRNNNGLADAGEPVLKQERALPANFKFTGNLNVARYVSFAPTGATNLVGGGFQAGTLTLCQESGGDARQIIINATGRPRVQRIELNACP